MVTVELIVIMWSVVRRPVVPFPSKLSLPGHVGMMVVIRVRGPGILRPLREGYGQMPVFPVIFLLLCLDLRFFKIFRRLVIVLVQMVRLALGFIQSLRLIGMFLAFMVTVLFLVMSIGRAVVTVMPHARWSSLVSVSVPVMRVTVRSRVLPIWPFPGHRRWGSMWMDEAE